MIIAVALLVVACCAYAFYRASVAAAANRARATPRETVPLMAPLRWKRSPLVGGRFCRECGGDILKPAADRDGCHCKGAAFVEKGGAPWQKKT